MTFDIHLKDRQDATVPDEALVGVVLRITQTSEDLKSFADTNPASLWAEHLNRRQNGWNICYCAGFYMTKV